MDAGSGSVRREARCRIAAGLADCFARYGTEVEGLNPCSKQRPGLEIVFPGRVLLTDVPVSHPLTANGIAYRRSSAVTWQRRKSKNYAEVARASALRCCL